MSARNTLVRNPWTPLVQKSVQQSHSMNKKVHDILFHLYGFNLWFVAEKSIDDVRDEVTKALAKENWMPEGSMHAVATILTDEEITKKADEYSDYKKSVEERTQNSSIDFWL